MADPSMMDLVPKQVTVGPYIYSVTFDQQAAYENAYHGTCVYRARRIILDPMQANTEVRQTFLHEVLHGLGDAYGIKEWGNHTFDADGRPIDKIDLMATALIMFLRANRSIVPWLLEES